jgi:asparagine synthase (glutamine-hydrolysing)
VLYLNLRTYLQDDLLPKADRMTMAHGLEARSPLLDRALVEYVFTLPAEYKIQNGRGKRILRRVFGGLVPDKILARPKHGFGVPLGAWFRRDLRGRIEEALLGAPALGRLLDASRVATLCREHLEGRVDRGQQLWQLLMLELWLRKYRLA